MLWIKKFSQRHIVLFSLAVSICTLLIAALFIWDDKPVMGFDKLVGDTLITLFCLMLIRAIGIWDTAGIQRNGFAAGLVLGIPFLAIGVGSAIIGSLGTNASELAPAPFATILLFTVNMFMVGVNEEISMRSLLLNNLLIAYGDTHRGVWKGVILSALVFGAVHIPNIFFMEPMTMIMQVFVAASGGTLFAAIYIRSRNIWCGIILHMLVDWLSLFMEQCFVGGSSILSIEMSIGQVIIMTLLGSFPPVAISLFLLRKSKFKRWV